MRTRMPRNTARNTGTSSIIKEKSIRSPSAMSLLCSQPCMTDGIHTSLIQVLSTQQSTTFPFIHFVTHIFALQPSEMLADLLFSVTSISLALSSIQTEWNSDIIADQNSGAILANGIIFNHVTKILLAEKFINVDFLVPFPKFEMNVSAELGAYVNKLTPLWDASRWQCHLDYSTNFQKNDSTFDVDWLLHQVENEVTLAEKARGSSHIYLLILEH